MAVRAIHRRMAAAAVNSSWSHVDATGQRHTERRQTSEHADRPTDRPTDHRGAGHSSVRPSVASPSGPGVGQPGRDGGWRVLAGQSYPWDGGRDGRRLAGPGLSSCLQPAPRRTSSLTNRLATRRSIASSPTVDDRTDEMTVLFSAFPRER